MQNFSIKTNLQYIFCSYRSYFPKTCPSCWDVLTCWIWLDHLFISRYFQDRGFISRDVLWFDVLSRRRLTTRISTKHHLHIFRIQTFSNPNVSFCSRRCWNKSSYLHLHHFNLELCRRHHPSEYRRWRNLPCWKKFIYSCHKSANAELTNRRAAVSISTDPFRILLHSWLGPVILNCCGCL